MTAYHRCRRSNRWYEISGAALFCGMFSAAQPACGPRPGSEAPGRAICDERLSPPVALELPPAPPGETPRSGISIAVTASTKALGRELERHVPVTLADVRRQPVGAPGEASYRVRRGSLGVALQGDRIFVTTPVTVDIEVCKPFGSLCIRYGSCTPQLLAAVSLPATLGRDYRVGPARASIEITRPCFILGNDVSGPIRDAARDQAAQVERRVNGALPNLRSGVALAWQLLELPLALGPRTCVRVQLERIAQQKPRTAQGAITTQLALSGRLGVEQPCPPNPATTPLRPLPELDQVAEVTPGVMLEIPIRVGWSEVSAELSRSLALHTGSPPPLRILRARAFATSRDGKGALGLETTLEGRVCGDVTWIGEPWYDARTSRVRLRGVALARGEEHRAELLDEYDLERSIEQHAAIALPVDVSGAQRALSDLVQRGTADLPDSVALRFRIEAPRIDRVLLETDALVPVATLSGDAALELK
jgi:hypothetical protein